MGLSTSLTRVLRSEGDKSNVALTVDLATTLDQVRPTVGLSNCRKQLAAARPHRLSCVLLSGLLLCVFGSNAEAQDVLLEQPRLEITGPKGQLVYLFTRYFDGAEASKVVTSRFAMGGEARTLELEFGYSGIEVEVYSPTAKPVVFRLMNGDQEVSTQPLQAVGFAKVQWGSVQAGAKFENSEAKAVRASLQLVASDHGLLQQFVEGFRVGTWQTLVSDSELRNVDWEILDAFGGVLREAYGGMQTAPGENGWDGWLKWEGNRGALLLDGPVECEKGRCYFTLAFVDKKLVDVQFRAARLADDWSVVPAATLRYANQSQELFETLFRFEDRASAEQARSLIAQPYRDDVSIEGVKRLQGDLKTVFTTPLTSIEFVRAEGLGGQPARFRLYHLIRFESGKHCVGETLFETTGGERQIGVARLASVKVRPAWTSATPLRAEKAKQTLTQLKAGSIDASSFSEACAMHLDFDTIQQSFTRSATAEMLPGVEEMQMESWATVTQGTHGAAEGSVDVADDELRLSVFSEAKGTLGVTLVSDFAAWTSLSRLKAAEELGTRGDKFWYRLLAGDLDDAHRVLGDDFQSQMPFKEFEELVEVSGFARGPKVRAVKWDRALLTHRLDRSMPVMVSSYHLAEFRDGSTTPLRCEYRWHGNEWELIDFSSDFNAVFPVEPRFDGVVELISALNNGDAEGLIASLHPPYAALVERPVLDAFLLHFQKQLGELGEVVAAREIHEYRSGRRFDRIDCLLKHTDRRLPLHTAFSNGNLLSFALDTDLLARPLATSFPEEHFRRRAELFVQAWMTEDPQKLGESFSIKSSNETLESELSSWKGGSQLSLGAYQSAVVREAAMMDEGEKVRCMVELIFERGRELATVDFSVDAFSSHIADVRIVKREADKLQ
ncbi:MAG: hypothetical protein AB8B50_02815 [Pirellulaceae bacterium]